MQMLKNIDFKLSGTSCCSLLLNGKHLIIANIGDSRALIISENAMSRQLTIDLTLEEPEERKRIWSQGGKILGKKLIVGDVEYAMTRSLGDHLAH